MRTTILGSADAFNSAGRGHSCYWVDDPEGALCVDFGPTALSSCKRLGREVSELDAIVLTHLHGDHVGGLPVLLVDLQYRARRRRPLRLYGPPGTAARVGLLMRGAYPDVWEKGLGFALPVLEYAVPGEVEVQRRRLRVIAAEHDRAHFACSLRLETSGRVLAFSGDTGWQDALPGFVRGADLFVCECTDREAGYASHLSLERLAEHRAELDVGCLVLTHLGEQMRAAAPELRSQGWVLAEDGEIYEV